MKTVRLLCKFNLFKHFKICVYVTWTKMCSSDRKVQFVHLQWNLHFSNIYQNSSSVTKAQSVNLYQKFNLEHWWNFFTCYKSSICSTSTSLIFMKTVHLLHKFNLFTHFKTCLSETLMEFVHLLTLSGPGGGTNFSPHPLVLITCCTLKSAVMNSKILDNFSYDPIEVLVK